MGGSLYAVCKQISDTCEESNLDLNTIVLIHKTGTGVNGEDTYKVLTEATFDSIHLHPWPISYAQATVMMCAHVAMNTEEREDFTRLSITQAMYRAYVYMDDFRSKSMQENTVGKQNN